LEWEPMEISSVAGDMAKFRGASRDIGVDLEGAAGACDPQ